MRSPLALVAAGPASPRMRSVWADAAGVLHVLLLLLLLAVPGCYWGLNAHRL